jgi:phospholipid-binding lipoprotein MlaA
MRAPSEALRHRATGFAEFFVIIASLSWRSWRRIGSAALFAAAAVLAGCATPPADPAGRAAYEAANDPLEPLNRKTFELNQFVDRIAFKPAAKAYLAVVPGDARTGIHHVLDNLKEPTLFFDNLLQGQFQRASTTLGRFVVNSTVGFGGLVDVMSLNGVDRQPADFGQTLYVWGLPSGPYLVLPILGPTNPRDAIGSAVDSYADPTTIVVNDHDVTEVTTLRFVVGGIEERASVIDVLDDLEKNSVDFYAEIRSLAQQRRATELRNGKAPDAEPDLYLDPGKPVAPPAPGAPVKPGAASPPALRTAALGASHPPPHRHPRTALAKRRTPVSRCAAPRCAAPKA